MYPEISLLLSLTFIFGGLFALAWSSDAFVDGAAALARRVGISPFIIGMVIIGFGTCAPEFFVSLFSGLSNHTKLSLGNAYGSCVFNIAAILGISALISPLVVKRSLVTVGAPLVTLVSLFSMFFLSNGDLSRLESAGLLAIFFVIMPLYCWYDQRGKNKNSSEEDDAEKEKHLSTVKMFYYLIVGLVVMVGASHLLVWGSVDLARALRIDEMVIGLTIVAIGTSVPELATAVAAARKGESELVLGNIVGSNLFNMLCVVGTSGALSSSGISDFSVRDVVWRDLSMTFLVSAMLILFGVNFSKKRSDGVITRTKGLVWVLMFVGYLAYMLTQEISKHG